MTKNDWKIRSIIMYEVTSEGMAPMGQYYSESSAAGAISRMKRLDEVAEKQGLTWSVKRHPDNRWEVSIMSEHAGECQAYADFSIDKVIGSALSWVENLAIPRSL